MSAAPPTANVLTIRTCRFGQSSAENAGADAMLRPSKPRIASRFTAVSLCSGPSPVKNNRGTVQVHTFAHILFGKPASTFPGYALFDVSLGASGRPRKTRRNGENHDCRPAADEAR